MTDENDPQRPPLLTSDERLECFIEAAEDYAIVTVDPSGCISDWNRGAERLLGWPRHEVVGKSAASVLPVPVANVLSTPEIECLRKDGSRFRAGINAKSFHETNGTLRAYAIVIRDIAAGLRAPDNRAGDKPWLSTTIDSAMDAIITVNARQQIILFNKAAEAVFRCSAAEAHGEKLGRFIPQQYREGHVRHVEDFGATGVTSRAMGHLGTLNGLRSNGGEFPVEASISQTVVAGEKLFTVILRDITQRKRAEERQSLLLLELAHRVKNTLAIVQSIVAQTRRFAAPEAFYETLTGRLVALGNAHDLLTNSDWAGATLADVVGFAFSPYEGLGAPERSTVNGPPIWLASNEAVTLSLVLHELAANAVKYGALSNSSGTVSIEWTLDPGSNPTALTVLWREQGGPNVAAPSRQGFGSRLVHDAIAHEMFGSSKLVFHPSGVECRLHVPLSQKVYQQQ